MRWLGRALCSLALAASTGAIHVVDEIQSFKDKCFETTRAEGGKAATVTKKRLVVWDPEAPCGEGKAFFHYTPTSGSFIPMTADVGPSTHTYRAAVFTNYNDYGTWVGRCGQIPVGGVEEFTWKVANKDRGASCPGGTPKQKAGDL
mmetsp:Transcript_108399/g.337826  ORF Transcript_108399/g.337826 Transcript_108399/m.337826 type:complete len:146 (+) Transcript_108399:52-489(+)